MPSVRIHADDQIIIQHKSAGKIYIDSAANYALDAGTTPPAVPPGFIHRFYDADSLRQLAADGESEEILSFGVHVPEFDEMIANLDTLLAAQAAREAVPPA